MSSNDHRYGLILAGGRGTRFWPRSRRATAKQVLTIHGDRSLIQSTVDRLTPSIPPSRIWVLTNDHLRPEIIRQLPNVPKSQILAEPAQRNTAPAIGLAARILESIDPEAVMGVFPADHVISKPKHYLQLLKAAFRAADEGRLVVLGVRPRHPETGFGYIEFPRGTRPGTHVAVPVHRFREKPDLKTAQQYLRAGNYFWNAGMFFWRARVFLDALREHLPKTATLLDTLPAFSDRRFAARVAEVFPKTENISVDFAVMEKAANVYGIACDEFGWSDVGSWEAVYALNGGDGERNVLLADAIAEASKGNYVDSAGNKKKLIALLGVDNLIVVDTPDALLIADRRKAQDVGSIVKLLEQRKRSGLL